MTRGDETFDPGDIYVTPGVTQELSCKTLSCAIRCHLRFATHIHPPSQETPRLDGPRVIRSSHCGWDQQRDAMLSFEVMTLTLGGDARTVVYLVNDVDYGSVGLRRFDPDGDIIRGVSRG